MEWIKVPTDILARRAPDKEILAIVKYQMVWGLLEREPTEREALRWMTRKQLDEALSWADDIKNQMQNDLDSINAKRKRDKKYYKRNQCVNKNSDALTDGLTDALTDGLTDALTDGRSVSTDKIREDKTKENPLTGVKERGENFSLPPSREISSDDEMPVQPEAGFDETANQMEIFTEDESPPQNISARKINSLSEFEAWNWRADEVFCCWLDLRLIPLAASGKQEILKDENFFNRQKEECINYCRSKGKKYKDYAAFFKNWILKECKNRRIIV